MFASARDFRNRPLGAAACRHAEQTISSPSWGAVRFPPLGGTPFRDSRYALLVWTYAAVSMATVVAVRAENLKAWREAVVDDPLVKLRPA